MSLVGNDIVVINEQGERLQANVSCYRHPEIPGVGPDYQGAVQGVPLDYGFAFWNAEQGGMRLVLSCDGYEPQEVIATSPDRVRVVMQRARPRRVHVDGMGYRDDLGQPWRGYSVDSFRAFQRYLSGQNIEPLFAQARSVGANMIRVFGMWGLDFQTPDNFGPFSPQSYPDYYAYIPGFCEVSANYGLSVEFTVFADTAFVMPNEAEQVQHFTRVCEALRQSPGTFVELVNENDAHGNRVRIEAFTKPDGIAACSGSNGAGSNPTVPLWDYSNLHAERREGRMGITTSTVYYAIHGYQGENGAPDWPGTHQATNNDEPGKPQDAATAYEMGTGSRYGGWITYHSTSGTQSLPLNDSEQEFARQMFRGARGL